MKLSSVILLVENDKDYIYILEDAFRKAEIRNPLKIARYGNEAILYMRGVGIYADRRTYPLPAIVVLDLANPDGSAIPLLGWIRDHSEFAQIPIVILAAETQEREVQYAFDRGANAYIVKRKNLAELTATLKSMELLSRSMQVQNEIRTEAAED
jgi:DNA-binding response OmpR family regulator